MGLSNGFTIFHNNMFTKRRSTTISTIGLQGAYSQFVRKACILRQLLQYSHRYSVPCSYSFLLTICIHRGNWVAGSPLFFRYEFFCCTLILSASNGSYLYFLLLWQGNSFLFFYSFLGREGWLGSPLFLVTEEGLQGFREYPGLPLFLATRVEGFKDIFLSVAGVTFISGYKYVDKGRYFIYYWRVGKRKVVLYLGIWGTPFLVFYAAITHTTSRRRTSAFWGSEGRVVRTTSISESSRDQETRLGSQG